MKGKRIRAVLIILVAILLVSTSAFAVPFKLPTIDLQTGKKVSVPKSRVFCLISLKNIRKVRLLLKHLQKKEV
jgi:hypothetical protein